MVNPLHPIVSVLNTALYDFYIVPLFLIVAGVFLSVRLGFPQVRYLIETFRVTREKPLHKHGISSFAALMVSPFVLANPWCLWVSKFSPIRTQSDWIGDHSNGLILI